MRLVIERYGDKYELVTTKRDTFVNGELPPPPVRFIIDTGARLLHKALEKLHSAS